MSFSVRVVTPERVVAEYEATSVSLPTPDGELTILAHHIPLVSLLAAGSLRITHAGGVEELVVSGGFVQVAPSDRHVTILPDFAAAGAELDMVAIEAAKQRAEAAMKEISAGDDVQYARAAAALERELTRYRTAIRHRSGRGLPITDQAMISKNENSI